MECSPRSSTGGCHKGIYKANPYRLALTNPLLQEGSTYALVLCSSQKESSIILLPISSYTRYYNEWILKYEIINTKKNMVHVIIAIYICYILLYMLRAEPAQMSGNLLDSIFLYRSVDFGIYHCYACFKVPHMLLTHTKYVIALATLHCCGTIQLTPHGQNFFLKVVCWCLSTVIPAIVDDLLIQINIRSEKSSTKNQKVS